MIRSTTFTLAFLWSIARGFSRNISVLTFMLFKNRRSHMEALIPLEFEKNNDKVINYNEFLKEKEDKGEFQKVKTEFIPDTETTDLFLN
ncbi:MAG: hypothetical protein ACK4ND_11595 [Cytophagaceae bacterium]